MPVWQAAWDHYSAAMCYLVGGLSASLGLSNDQCHVEGPSELTAGAAEGDIFVYNNS